MARRFHVMAKPRGAICNLDCRYCFYQDKVALYEGTGFRMSDETSEVYVRQRFESARGGLAEFAWQGGEPTLMGLPFFERVVELQEKHCPPGTEFTNGIQTNGVLLDDDWCRFLVEHDFLVGLSLDGPRELHDAHRVDKRGRPSFDRVMNALGLLQQHGTEFNVLATVNDVTGDHPLEVYHFLRDEAGVEYIQFIPIVERGEDAEATVTGSSVGSRQYGDFLIAVFDEWVREDVGKVFVQIFDVALAAYAGLPSPLCSFSETCGTAMALEHNGDLYSCDHFVGPSNLLGNITVTPMAELARSPAQTRFGLDKRDTLPQDCLDCSVRIACAGGCPKNRFVATGDEGRPLNYLCPSYEAFFSHVRHPMELMADLLHRGAPVTEVTGMLEDEKRRSFARAGRNDPCPCGSGRKLKHCHGRS